MQLDQNPFFRKAITPWYDSTFSCRLLILAMVVVFAFGVAGFAVAVGEPELAAHSWFPGFLAFLSGMLAVKIFFRLRARAKND